VFSIRRQERNSGRGYLGLFANEGNGQRITAAKINDPNISDEIWLRTTRDQMKSREITSAGIFQTLHRGKVTVRREIGSIPHRAEEHLADFLLAQNQITRLRNHDQVTLLPKQFSVGTLGIQFWRGQEDGAILEDITLMQGAAHHDPKPRVIRHGADQSDRVSKFSGLLRPANTKRTRILPEDRGGMSGTDKSQSRTSPACPVELIAGLF